jgi:hypothetical protein
MVRRRDLSAVPLSSAHPGSVGGRETGNLRSLTSDVMMMFTPSGYVSRFAIDSATEPITTSVVR